MKMKELKQLIKLCRQSGVTAVEFNGIKLNIDLDFLPPQVTAKSVKATTTEQPKLTQTRNGLPIVEDPANAAILAELQGIKSDGPNDDQLLDWSIRDESEDAAPKAAQ